MNALALKVFDKSDDFEVEAEPGYLCRRPGFRFTICIACAKPDEPIGAQVHLLR